MEEDTEEVEKRRGLSQSEIGQSWKNLGERMEEEVLDKYKVEESSKEAFRGRVAPLELRKVRCTIRKCVEGSWARIFSLFGKYFACSVSKANRKS